LTGCTPEILEKRLKIFEQVRMKRASVMQVFSNAGQDEPEKIHAEASRFIPAETVPSKSAPFQVLNSYARNKELMEIPP
jgi:salicylate hydroxylase